MIKTSIARGQTETVCITVSPEMVATFGDRVVHDLYSTNFLVQHMELAARKLIVPHFEPNQEAISCRVDVTHIAITLPGMKVDLKATVSDIRENKVEVEVEATNIRGRIARGWITLAIVDKAWLEKRRKELAVIQNIAANGSPAVVS